MTAALSASGLVTASSSDAKYVAKLSPRQHVRRERFTVVVHLARDTIAFAEKCTDLVDYAGGPVDAATIAALRQLRLPR